MDSNVMKISQKILIVDDDKSVREFLKLFLHTKGFQYVEMVETGKAALQAIAQDQDIKLVLLDVMLPDINGMELLRQIKAIVKDIGVIMITGYPDEQKAKEALKQGAYDYIIKPFDLAYLELSLVTKIVKMS